MDSNQRAKTLVVWMVFALTAYVMMNMLFPPPGQPQAVQISTFVRSIEDGTIGWVSIMDGHVLGITKDRKERFVSFTAEPKRVRDALFAKHVPFRELPAEDNSSGFMIFQFVLIGLMGFLFFRMMRGAQSGGGAGPLKQFMAHKGQRASKVKERFTDVAGSDEAVADVRDIVSYLKNPKDFSRLGGRMPRGILLVGPPGTGKTLLARALAGEADVPFLSISGSEFVEMFVGVGAARVRDLFEEARRHQSCIIFIDEIDGLGKSRSSGPFNGGHSEHEQTLNQLLSEMDGFMNRQGVVVIGATNKPEAIDPALLRPGRFDRQVQVLPPDLNGRVAVLKVHLNKPDIIVEPDLDLHAIARSTPGLTGADLENLVNEAALLATKAKKPAIQTEDFHRAIEKIALGAERRGLLMSLDDKNIVAWHEAGHTVAGWFTPGADPVHRVSIIPRGKALGVTWTTPEEDRHLHRKSHLLTRIKVLLGGRVAETLLLGAEDITTGASDDLSRVTDLARRMVTRFGMSKLGTRTYGRHEQGFLGEHEVRDYGDSAAASIDEEVRNIVASCLATVTELLTSRKTEVASLASALIAEETVDADRLLAILGPRPKKN